MANKLYITCYSLIVFFFSQNSFADDLIPAEHFACYGNSHSMQLSPDGRYLSILTQPKEDKCDIEPDSDALWLEPANRLNLIQGLKL